VAPARMSQRLARVRGRLGAASIRLGVPGPREFPARVAAVLEAIYAAFGSGWDDVAGADPRRRGLADEAIWLGRLVTRLLPGEAEALGLLALMLHCGARRPARRGARGRDAPLDRPDVRHWSRAMVHEAEPSPAPPSPP